MNDSNPFANLVMVDGLIVPLDSLPEQYQEVVKQEEQKVKIFHLQLDNYACHQRVVWRKWADKLTSTPVHIQAVAVVRPFRLG